MCFGCWPFADVWLEEPPKEKKKEPQKEEETTERIFVPDGAVLYPVSPIHLVESSVAHCRKSFLPFTNNIFVTPQLHINTPPPLVEKSTIQNIHINTLHSNSP